MNQVIFIILIVATLAVAEAVYYFVRYLAERKSDELKRRLRVVGEPEAGAQILRRSRLANSDWAADLLSGFAPFEKVERLLEQTDLELTVGQLILASVAMSGGGAAVGVVVLHRPMVGLLLALVGLAVPFLYVLNERVKRSAKLSEQLPEALEMMARSIKAGHALPSSFKLVAQECPQPVAVEFAKAYEQQNLGIPFERAVINMCDRVPGNLDLRLFAVSVVVQKETGGNLVEVLETISNTTRDRFKFYSKLRALTAEGKISGIILGCLPWVVAAMVAATNPNYLRELTIGTGRVVLAAGICSWAFGIVWIRSLMKVDY